jgi:hypothetical protein
MEALAVTREARWVGCHLPRLAVLSPIPLNHRVPKWAVLDSLEYACDFREKLTAQAGTLPFVPLKRLQQVRLGLGTEEQRWRH